MRRTSAAVQSDDGGRAITSPRQLEEALRVSLAGSAAGVSVTPESALRVGAVFACVRLISGAVANLPLQVMRREGAKTRVNLTWDDDWEWLRRRPNDWQTPSQMKRMLQAHLLLRGNGYALKVKSRRRVIGLNPLDPDRMRVDQLDDLSLAYTYTRRNGSKIVLPQDDVLHLVGLSLDGVRGVSPITYARESIGLSIAQERHGAKTMKNSARPSTVLTHPERIGAEAVATLRASLDEYRAGGEAEGHSLVLEEGMTIEKISMTNEDAQWIEARKFSRGDIAMFFGVPPHMIGDVDKQSSWGTGIESQGIGFVTYTLEDHLTTWEESLDRSIVSEPNVYTRFNRSALIRGDFKSRVDGYAKALQWGWMNTDEVRSLEDMNPREDGEGGRYYDPPNTAGTPAGTSKEDTET
ncbi:phage portal protein [Tropicimonas marinistellae]|uniref:phage portal protein n=1 Tax=Tropicimonas marinistellae TaxID=1739787 RepID=UPI001F28F506|nr:phage portal protein [Tropicimonas marinistellae]